MRNRDWLQLRSSAVAVLFFSLAPALTAQLPLTLIANQQSTDSTGFPFTGLNGAVSQSGIQTDGTRVYFLVADSACSRLESAPVGGGTATPLFIAPGDRLESAEPATSDSSLCWGSPVVSGSDLFFGAAYLLSTNNRRVGYFAIPVTGGSSADAVATGDPSPQGPLTDSVTAYTGDTHGNLLAFGGGSAGAIFGSFSPNGSASWQVPGSSACDGVSIEAALPGQIATDGTTYATLVDGTETGTGTEVQLITLAQGGPSLDCHNVVFAFNSAQLNPAPFPGSYPVSLGRIQVASGKIYLSLAAGPLEQSPVYTGIFALQGGTLTKIVTGTDTLPGLTGANPLFLSGFAAAGNHLVFTARQNVAFNQFEYGLYAVNLTTGKLQLVTAPGTTATGIAAPEPGSLSADGHLAFFEYSSSDGGYSSSSLYSADVAAAQPVLPNGYYFLQNSASGLVLDDPGFSPDPGTALFQYWLNGGSNQMWLLTSNGQGFYTLQNKSSQLFLTATSATLGTQMVQEAQTHDDRQLWSLARTSGGIVMMNKATGLVIDDAGGSLEASASIILWSPHDGNNQNWAFQAVQGQFLPDGPYTLQNVSSGLVLDDPGSSSSSGQALYQWTANGGNNQVWNLKFNGAGFYTITNASSGLLLSASGIDQSVMQADASSDGSQLWSLTEIPSGVVIQNKLTGLVVDDAGFQQSLGPFIISWPANGGINQSWAVQSVP